MLQGICCVVSTPARLWKCYMLRLVTPVSHNSHHLKNSNYRTPINRLLEINRKNNLLPLQPSCFISTSTCLRSSKARNTKKKLVKPIKGKLIKKEHLKPIKVYSGITVAELAAAMEKSIDHLYEVMLYVPGSEIYDHPDARIKDPLILKRLAELSGMRIIQTANVQQEKQQQDLNAYPSPPANPRDLRPRPPVVTIMGHVDHGKTTLLDAFRKSHIVDQEFGGITQHIGAFSVSLGNQSITFLDTPGHAAFSAMRSRGANVTDIVVLVVAADDGVMQQTIESIKYARDAKVSLIVAINKIDKYGVDIDYTKESLLNSGIQLEEQGGDIQAVEVSALTGENLESLKEAILTQAEVLDLKGDPIGQVEGSVIECRTHQGKGKLATVLVQRGTLKKGCILVAGRAWAKVRAMYDENSRAVKSAGPGEALEVSGWKELPHPGDQILQVKSEQRAHEVMKWRQQGDDASQALLDKEIIQRQVDEHRRDYEQRKMEKRLQGHRRGSLYRYDRTKEVQSTHEEGQPELAIIIKGDVDGSVEAILDSLMTYQSNQCRLEILHYGVGSVCQSDIEMAKAFSGIIYSFNVDIPSSVYTAASEANVDVRFYNIIYKMFDDMKQEMTDRLPPLIEDDVLGEATVQQLFSITDRGKKRPVAGCRCTKGMLYKNHKYKLIRNDNVIYEGTVLHMKHHKSDVETINTDVECGISFSDLSVLPEPGDTVICYQNVEVPQTLNWDLYDSNS